MAVALAATPVFDELWATYPHTTLDATPGLRWVSSWPDGKLEVGYLDDRLGPLALL